MKKYGYLLLMALFVNLFLFSFALAQSNTFANPIGVNSISQLLQAIMSYLKSIIAVISLIFIIIGGILYMLSSGDETMIKRAKACITGAVIGFAITLAAPAFLNDVQTILGVGSGGGGLAQIALGILQFLLSIFGIIGIIMLVVAGIMYMTSAGDQKQIDTAKKILTYSIVGIVIAFSALIIVQQVAIIIGG